MASDTYASAKSGLRENVKTLVTVFSGVAGVIVAGTPFSGLGELAGDISRFALAAGTLLLAVLVLGVAVLKLLGLLEPDLVYQDILLDTFDISDVATADRADVKKLRDEFQARKHQLLPAGISSVEQLRDRADRAWDEYDQHSRSLDPTEQSRADAKRKSFDDLLESEQELNNWAAFILMRIRFRRKITHVFFLGLVALFLLATFAIVVASGKREKAPEVLILHGAAESQAELPVLPPVLFETNRADLLPAAFDTLRSARDILRSRPELGLLLFAYADTRGSSGFNASLARRRSEAVLDALVKEGGIARSRLFVAELGRTDLPRLTAPETASDANRSVNLVLIAMPTQKSRK